MKLKKLYIWYSQDAEPKLLPGDDYHYPTGPMFGWLLPEQPQEMVYTGECVKLTGPRIEALDKQQEKSALSLQENYEKSNLDPEDFMEQEGISYEPMEAFSWPDRTVVFDFETLSFGVLDDFETYPAINYWDGNNMVWATLGENEWQEIIEVEDQGFNCDRWDGNNLTTGGTGLSLIVYRTKDDRYLVIHGTSWQGEDDQATVFDKQDFLEYMTKINREKEARNIIRQPQPKELLEKKISKAKEKSAATGKSQTLTEKEREKGG